MPDPPPSARNRGTKRDRPARHILLAAYLYSPCSAVPVHRPVGLRRGFEAAGVRTTILTSKISGSLDDDGPRRIIRAGDLRTRFQTQYQSLVGYNPEPVAERTKPRWWTNLIVPDITALTWLPQATWRLLRLIRSDRPDVIVTTSGPESTHLLGLVARVFGVRWVADYRDGWLRDATHPFFVRWLDRLAERLVNHCATIVTAVSSDTAADISRRYSVRAHHVSNGFNRAELENATDERAQFDPERFSLVYTGLLALDLYEPVLHRGKFARTFFAALELLAEREPGFAASFELVVAGPISDAERESITSGKLSAIVSVLGQVPHERALGLQRAADGLLLISGAMGSETAKIYEYMAACKPVFAVALEEAASSRLLAAAGEHTVAPPESAEALARVLSAYLARWSSPNEHYQPRADFDLGAYEYLSLGKKMLDLITSNGQSDQGTVTPER